jgi:hypothetical protein
MLVVSIGKAVSLRDCTGIGLMVDESQPSASALRSISSKAQSFTLASRTRRADSRVKQITLGQHRAHRPLAQRTKSLAHGMSGYPASPSFFISSLRVTASEGRRRDPFSCS